MLRCPNCNNKIPFWKTLKLNITNFSGITCSTCKKILFIDNKKNSSWIGGIGGGVGALVLINLVKSNFRLNAVIITILWFLSIVFVSNLFTKFKIKDK
ncbi:hypothetical protein G9F72_023295 [Clostridium estertheticum]|uniref:hypothetical protein n=1 Tax=Clostridium estertheticum TaxID=238834 RepID=UPI0013E97FDF|nr:hypothetical protein [Clostridium estertheticum]MBZ9689226.1 hypothetical protein [Clostridium estertheticum]